MPSSRVFVGNIAPAGSCRGGGTCVVTGPGSPGQAPALAAHLLVVDGLGGVGGGGSSPWAAKARQVGGWGGAERKAPVLPLPTWGGDKGRAGPSHPTRGMEQGS